MPSPAVVALAPAEPDAFVPLRDLAEVILPDGGVQFSAADVREFQAGRSVEGLIIPGEFPMTAELLDALPSLRIVANTAAGYNNLPLEDLARRGIWATNTPEAFVEATADATLGLILALARHIAAGDAYVRSGRWPLEGALTDRWSGLELGGKILGLVGFGRIGRAVAVRAEAFGMRVIFHRREGTGDPRQRDFATVLADADILALLVPLTPETRHLIDGEALSRMKPGAYLVNIARGAVVDEAALVRALRDGRIAGAALDVFEHEPRVTEELLSMKQVVLTPHLGGATREARFQARTTASRNVAAALRGERPPDALNTPAGF